MNKTNPIYLLPFLLFFFASGELLSQFVKPCVEIIIPEGYPGNTEWTVESIDLELRTDFTWYNNEYFCFGGTFKTSFENFDYHVDSISIDLGNWCSSCFDLILYKLGEEAIYNITPSGYSIQTIVNPWTDNPDSLVLWSYEAGVKIETVYYDTETNQIENKEERETYVYPNPAVNYFKLKNIENNSNVKVYSSTGVLLVESSIFSHNNMIDISFLKTGVYLVEIETQSGRHYHKVVKSNY